MAAAASPSRPDLYDRPRGGQAARGRRQAVVAWLFSLPFVAGFAVFMLFPIVSSLVMSFTNFSTRHIQRPLTAKFVGVDQYVQLFQSDEFIKSLTVTGYFVLVGIPLTMAVGLALALALNTGITKFRAVFRVGFYAPVVTSIVAIAVVWRFMLQDNGVINAVLGWVGIDGPNWLNSTTWAMPAMILMAVWRNMGTMMIIYLAGLQAIPADVKEAALIDGAGAWSTFWRITLPLLRPTILLSAVLLSVGFLQFFEEPFVMTKGGPLSSTLSISYFTFNQFGFGKYGTASAASYVLFVLIALLSLVQFRVLRSQD